MSMQLNEPAEMVQVQGELSSVEGEYCMSLSTRERFSEHGVI
jgi:hypothetical protein